VQPAGGPVGDDVEDLAAQEPLLEVVPPRGPEDVAVDAGEELAQRLRQAEEGDELLREDVARADVERGLAAPLVAKPEMCSLNMGSMNFNIARAGDRVKEWKYDWEKPYLDRTDNHIFRNTFKDIASIVERLGKAHGTRFEYECYDIGHLYNLAYCLDQKIVEPPLFVQTIFGILGGIGADQRNLLFMRETADKLFGDAYVWSVLAAGRHQMAFTTMAGIMGGNVRVGLEDSLYIGRGALAKSNAEQVAKIRRILEELSLEIATPKEAREILKLKGGDRVGF